MPSPGGLNITPRWVCLMQPDAVGVQRPFRLHAAAETVALPQDRALAARQSLLQMHEATDLDLGCRQPVADGRHPFHHLPPEFAEAADGDAAGLARLYPAREGIGNNSVRSAGASRATADRQRTPTRRWQPGAALPTAILRRSRPGRIDRNCRGRAGLFASNHHLPGHQRFYRRGREG